ncbi:MAG TPA: hypothetical protein VJC03_00545, partial [bacterium]|nr:hypothetical protein [bacterium]
MSDKKRLQGNTDTDAKVNCPICGYFTGIEPICPRCGANTHRKMSISFIRRISIAGSIAGIILLWLAAYLKKPQLIKIGEITETMSNALVVIEGDVTRLQMDGKKNTLRMTIDDGTGYLTANAFNKLKKFQKVLGEKMPALKDKVRITGSLSISQTWGTTMFLSVPTRVEVINRYVIEERNIDQISADDEGELFWINAEIFEYEEYTTAKGYVLHKFVLGDDTGEIPMVLFSTEIEAMDPEIRKAATEKGRRFRMRVEVSSYRGDPQVKLIDPADPENIRPLLRESLPAETDSPSGVKKEWPKKAAKDLNETDLGKVFLITAGIREVNYGIEAGGVFLSLKGTEKRIFVKFNRWQRMEGAAELEEGNAVITAPVRVEKSGGKIQLSIEDFKEVRIKKLLPKPEKPEENTAGKKEEPAAMKQEITSPDISGIEKKSARDIVESDEGKIFLIEEDILDVNFGVDGVYLSGKNSPMEFIVSHGDWENIAGAGRLESGKGIVKGAFLVFKKDGKLFLKALYADKVEVLKQIEPVTAPSGVQVHP